MADTEGFGDTLGVLTTRPTILADAIADQAGQLYGSLPGGVAGPQGLILNQAVAAGGQSGEDAYQRVLEKGSSSRAGAEAARTLAAGVPAAVNTVGSKVIPGGSALEDLITGQVTKGVSRSAARAAAAPVIGEAAAETLTEVLDQAGQNLAVGDPLDTGLGKAAGMGLALGTAMGTAPGARDARQSVLNRRERATENADNILRNLPVLPETDPAYLTPDNTGLQGDLFGDAPADSPSFEEQEAARQKSYEEDAAWKQRNKERECAE